MPEQDIAALRDAIAALEGQRATLGDEVLELALAPLRARLAALERPAGLKHRQVAVLFVDVVGSTALAQALEVEDTLDLLGGALRRMADIVQAHQGRVLRFTGDGVKAAFGMDEAREDDAERAVRAGLAMLDAGRELAAQAMRLHGVPDFAVRPPRARAAGRGPAPGGPRRRTAAAARHGGARPCRPPAAGSDAGGRRRPGQEPAAARARRLVLAALGDVRAAGLIERVHADLHARLSHLADDAERERVIADSSSYSAMVVAYRCLHGAPTAAG